MCVYVSFSSLAVYAFLLLSFFLSFLLTFLLSVLLSFLLSPSVPLLLTHTPLPLFNTLSHTPPPSSCLTLSLPPSYTALADVVDSYTLGGPQPGQTAPVALALSLDIVVEVRTYAQMDRRIRYVQRD